MLNAFGSLRNLDKRRLQLAKNTGVVQAAGDGAGSPSALMVLLCVALVVLLCVWCVAGIGARAHRESLDAQTIKTPYDQRVTSQTYDTEYVVCHRSFSHYLASASLALHLFLGPNHT